MGDPRCSNLRWCVVPVVSYYVGDGMSVYKHCIHYDGDEDCDKCCVHGYIFNCPSNCKEYLDTWDNTVTNFYDMCEIHKNCTVEIWTNSKTGKTSVGWYENGDEETE